MGSLRSASSDHSRVLLTAVIVSITTLGPGRAGAVDECGRSGNPWVSVAFADGTWQKGLKDAVFQDLRAGLASRHIDTCRSAEGISASPTAAVRLSTVEPDAIHVTVQVHDAVTDKELSRDVDLTQVPNDGHAFAIALAADELVWASWAEIAIRGNNRRAKAPAQLVAEVKRSIKPVRELPQRFGMQASMEHYLRGQTHFGPDIVFAFNWAPHFGMRVTGGYRQGLNATAPNGHIKSSALGMNLDLTATVLQTSRLALRWTLGQRSTWCRFKGEASRGALSGELSGLTIYARSGLIAAVRVSGLLWLQLGVGAGVPLRALEANDSGRVITGVSGLEQSAQMSVLGVL